VTPAPLQPLESARTCCTMLFARPYASELFDDSFPRRAPKAMPAPASSGRTDIITSVSFHPFQNAAQTLAKLSAWHIRR
jgi:hypothetical protein